MSEEIKDKKENPNNNKINTENRNSELSYINYYTLNMRYELLNPVIKDIQIISQLVRFEKKHIISDLIFIKGKNSYSIDSRFYFSYRNIIDFYVKVLNFIETDYFTKIKYHIYKTKPSSKEFAVNITLFYCDENSSKLTIEIILFNNATLNKKILNLIYNEFNQNFLYLIKALKDNKLKSFSFCSSIIKNEFYILTQILQNRKLIEYMINGEFKKLQKDNSNDKEKAFIKLAEKYIVNLKKKEDINGYLISNKIYFQIQLLKIKEDNMIIQFKIIHSNNEKEIINESNSIYNLITIFIRKLTTNSSFIFMRCTWDKELDANLINSINIFFQKCLHNLEKLSKTSKQC